MCMQVNRFTSKRPYPSQRREAVTGCCQARQRIASKPLALKRSVRQVPDAFLGRKAGCTGPARNRQLIHFCIIQICITFSAWALTTGGC